MLLLCAYWRRGSCLGLDMPPLYPAVVMRIFPACTQCIPTSPKVLGAFVDVFSKSRSRTARIKDLFHSTMPWATGASIVPYSGRVRVFRFAYLSAFVWKALVCQNLSVCNSVVSLSECRSSIIAAVLFGGLAWTSALRPGDTPTNTAALARTYAHVHTLISVCGCSRSRTPTHHLARLLQTLGVP